MKHFIYISLIRISDILFSPFTFLAALYFRSVRNHGITMFLCRMPLTKSIFMKVGIFPLSKHYYDPLFDHSYTVFDKERKLPWIDFNIKWQLELINNFNYQIELLNLKREKTKETTFYYNNWSFPPWDSEFLYSIIRFKKPRRIIEIGSGNSTLMVINAICKNNSENTNYTCKHICIEPYEAKWLEKLWVEVNRNKLEDIELDIFRALEENDILFIDSSHIIRPWWDVLKEYLEILPILKQGVLIHIHDIFTPYEYPKEWLQKWVNFWNEQYLVEAFLSHNKDFKIVCMMSYLNKIKQNVLLNKFPILKEKKQNPWSFWIQKIN